MVLISQHFKKLITLSTSLGITFSITWWNLLVQLLSLQDLSMKDSMRKKSRGFNNSKCNCMHISQTHFGTDRKQEMWESLVISCTLNHSHVFDHMHIFRPLWYQPEDEGYLLEALVISNLTTAGSCFISFPSRIPVGTNELPNIYHSYLHLLP